MRGELMGSAIVPVVKQSGHGLPSLVMQHPKRAFAEHEDCTLPPRSSLYTHSIDPSPSPHSCDAAQICMEAVASRRALELRRAALRCTASMARSCATCSSVMSLFVSSVITKSSRCADG